MPVTLRHIIPISGKDSLATALVQTALDGSLDYEYLFCDVGMELPETYAWLDSVEAATGFKITRIGKSLEQLMDEQLMLPSHHRRFCTRLGKIFPIRDYLNGELAVQYIGIRADESDRAIASSIQGLENQYPLIKIGMDLQGVYSLLETKNLLPPSFFWQKLYDVVYDRAGPATRPFIDNMKYWVRSHFFSWRSRSNCFMCFYQRNYEWLGLLEFHPDLFEKAEKLEYDYGSVANPRRIELGLDSTRETDFYFRQDRPLSHIRSRAKDIFDTRVSKVLKEIVEHRHRPIAELDELSLVNCGNYCGK